LLASGGLASAISAVGMVIYQLVKLLPSLFDARTRRLDAQTRQDAAQKALEADQPKDQEHRRKILELLYKQQSEVESPRQQLPNRRRRSGTSRRSQRRKQQTSATKPSGPAP
jgi:hypothetical protein